MQMAFVDGTDQVIVINSGGTVRAFQGICTHEYFELDKGFLTGGGSPGPDGVPIGTLTCALHLSRLRRQHVSDVLWQQPSRHHVNPPPC